MVRLTTRGRPRLTSSLVRSGLAAATLAAPFVTDLGPWLAPALLPLAHGLSGVWLGKGLLETDDLHRQSRAWQVSPDWELAPAAVPQGEAGLLLGKAFPWTGGHTQFLETALALDGSLPTAPRERGGHPVLHAVGQHQEHPLVLPWSEMVAHTLLTGTTRSGKTRLLELLASGVIQTPGATVILDPKGDRALMLRCAAEARRAGKPFALFTPAFPASSAVINVLGSATTPEEVSARIKALLPSGSGRPADPFFEEYALALIELIAEAQMALGQPWTLRGLYQASMIRHHQERLVEDYLLHLGCHKGKRIEDTISEYVKRFGHDLTADALIDDFQKPRDHFQKVTSNLRPAFRGVVNNRIGPLLAPAPHAVTWEQIVDTSMVMYIGLTSLLLQDIANRIGRAILQDFIGYIGTRYATHADPEHAPPLTVIIDEVGDVVYPGFTNALNKGGGANARFILAQQSFADLEAVIGDPQSQRIYDNLNTKVTFRLANDETAEAITKGFGTSRVTLPEDSASIGYAGEGGLKGTSTRRDTHERLPLVRPEWLKALPRGDAFVRMQGRLLKLRVPLLTPVSDEEREALGLTQLWHSLDTEKNEAQWRVWA